MKLLVFEYITGGGFSDQPLPESLLTEGGMMLKALLRDLQHIAGLELLVLLDPRCQALIQAMQVRTWIIPNNANAALEFQKLLDWAEAVWVIAPEFDGILERYSRWVERAGKRLLNSSASAVAIAANKWRTFKCLQSAGIATVLTRYLSQVDTLSDGAWVIKPVDGVGCNDTWLIENTQAYAEIRARIQNPADFLIQPFISGSTESLSALFYQGRGWLVCVNRQILTLENRRFALEACLVNAMPGHPAYQLLIDQIAIAIPGLYGYVGIDLMVTDHELVVIEINPRLTSSYAGIAEALGINCAQLILKLEQQEPQFESTMNRCVRVSIA